MNACIELGVQSDVFLSCFDETLESVPEGCEVLGQMYKHLHVTYDTWKKAINFIELPQPSGSYKGGNNIVYPFYKIEEFKELFNGLDLEEVKRFESDEDENNPLWALPAWEWRQHLLCIKFNSINWIIMNTRNIEVEE